MVLKFFVFTFDLLLSSVLLCLYKKKKKIICYVIKDEKCLLGTDNFFVNFMCYKIMLCKALFFNVLRN